MRASDSIATVELEPATCSQAVPGPGAASPSRRGLIVLPGHHWGDPAQLAAPVADLIVRRAEEIPLPPGHRIRAFHRQQPTPAATGDCADLPELAGARGGDT